jgi:hypothetical protein
MPAETATFRPVVLHERHELEDPGEGALVGTPHGQHDAELRGPHRLHLGRRRQHLGGVEEGGGLHRGVEARRLGAEVAVLGQPPVLADRIPSTSTSGPHQARRTSWANDASAVTDSSGTTANAVNSSARSSRRSSRRAPAAAAMRARAGRGRRGGSTTGQAPTGARRETVLRVGVRDAEASGGRASAHGSGRRRRGGNHHGVGLRDRAGVRGQAGLGPGLRGRGDPPPRDPGPRVGGAYSGPSGPCRSR